MSDDAPPTHSSSNQNWFASFLVLLFAMMSAQTSSLGFSPLLPAIQKEFAMSFSQIGTFAGIYGLVALVMSIPAGILATRYGERRVLWIGLCVLALGLGSLSVSQNYIQASSARIVWILGFRLAFVCVMTGIAVTTPPHLKGRATGISGAASAFATVLGAPFGAHIETSFGWRHAIQSFAGLALLGAAICCLFYPQRIAATKADVKVGGARPRALSAFRNPVVWTIPLLGLTNAGGFAATFFLPSVLKEKFGLDPSAAASVISLAYVSAIAINPFCGYLSDKANRWLVLAGMVAAMIPASLAMQAPDLMIFELSATVMIAFGMACNIQIYPAVSELMPGRDIGLLMGITALGGGLFGFLGPQTLGWLRDASGGFDAGWHAVTGAATLALFLILFLKKYADRAREPVNAAGVNELHT